MSKKQVYVARKSVLCQKKVNVAQNCISCRQEQYDAAQEKKIVLKKFIHFFEERRIILI